MKTFYLACTSVLALAAGVANATSALEETREQVVSYADLDLNDEAGAAELMQRIRAAARVVCRAPGVEWMTLDTFLRARRCREAATAQAVERVDAPLLTRLSAPVEEALSVHVDVGHDAASRPRS